MNPDLPQDEPNYKALYTERDEAREIAKRVPVLEFELRAKVAELEIADGEIERLSKYANLGQACESNGLAGFGADGTMWFQPPVDLIAEKAAQAAEQALSDLKREVLEKVGPFAETAAVLGNSKDSAVWAGQKPAPPLTFGHFRALSTLHDKLSSDVFPESPSGDVSTHAAGEGGEDGGLYPQFAEPLRRDLQYLDAALSTYGGTEASQDVARAWLRVLNALPTDTPNPSARGEL